MSAGRDAVDGDALGVDMELGSILAKPANEIPDIRHGFQGSDGFLIGEAVFSGDGNHATGRVMLSVVVQPFGSSGNPAASVQEDDRGTRVLFGCAGGLGVGRQK